MLAYVGLAPVINALVARLPKKRMLIGADLIRAAMALCLPLHYRRLADLCGDLPAAVRVRDVHPCLPVVDPNRPQGRKRTIPALSLSRLAYDMEALVSPAIAALLLTVVSYNNLFIGTVAGFLFSAFMVAITALPKASTHRSRATSLWAPDNAGSQNFSTANGWDAIPTTPLS